MDSEKSWRQIEEILRVLEVGCHFLVTDPDDPLSKMTFQIFSESLFGENKTSEEAKNAHEDVEELDIFSVGD